ncbi:MAG: response regulator [Planctomycetes bacterium]|nr:response regulator [Planctomycetota bacterium]
MSNRTAHSLSKEGSPALQQITEIQKISERAAALIKQMLAYSGKGKFVVAPLNLSQIIEELTHLLRISVSKKARLVCNFAADLPAVEADSTQVQQIVMNLITNASEALGDENGDIVVSTGVIAANREYLADSCLDTRLPEGEYVFVEVSDTGCGMNASTLSKIFDPFFTTKFTGRGLGMSAALGIMRGHKGTIKIDSTEGVGTTIRLLFPCLEKETEAEPFDLPDQTGSPQPESCGRGIVLVVDDEEFVREMACSILSSVGYRVETAVDGRDCLDVYEQHRDDVVAILLDLTMPRMNGAEVLRELRSRDRHVPVLLSSGYGVQEAEKRLNGEHFEGFLQKPYLRAALIDKIKEIVSA